MKQQEDLTRKYCTFKTGDWVLLRLRPYRQLSVVRRSSQKLAAKSYGPYKILEQIGPVAFRLDLPSGCKIHTVFHASLLRSYHTSVSSTVHHLPHHNETLPPCHIPTAIVSERTIIRHGRSVAQVLVQWSDLPPSDATWEDTDMVSLLPPTELSGESAPADGNRGFMVKGDKRTSRFARENRRSSGFSDVGEPMMMEEERKRKDLANGNAGGSVERDPLMIEDNEEERKTLVHGGESSSVGRAYLTTEDEEQKMRVLLHGGNNGVFERKPLMIGEVIGERLDLPMGNPLNCPSEVPKSDNPTTVSLPMESSKVDTCTDAFVGPKV